MSTQKDKILEQYSSEVGSRFYRFVMGDGSDHIHYGIYDNLNMTMVEALTASCQRLLKIASSFIEPASLKEILDLGAGAGGPAKCLLSWTGARLTCVDIGEMPLQKLQQWANTTKLSSRMRTVVSSFQELPSIWKSEFDLVWSQDALCHAIDRLAVFSEARRVLKSNGVFVFSDILLADTVSPSEGQAFSSVNAVQNLGTPQEYLKDLESAGFTEIISEDWSGHLEMNFRRMLQQIEQNQSKMLEEGISLELITRFANALKQRLLWKPGTVLQWRVYLCR